MLGQIEIGWEVRNPKKLQLQIQTLMLLTLIEASTVNPSVTTVEEVSE